MNKADFKINMQGFPLANRGAEFVLTNVNTTSTVKVKPFLDGSAVIRDLEPGEYELRVLHKNLINPIATRKIRLFPQPHPTVVNIPIPETVFVDNPIADVPDADLGPAQQAIAGVVASAQAVGNMSPGQAIRAADWNILAGAVVDLAKAVSDLTLLIAPQGHDHPEIANKIDEVEGNIRRFTESFGRSLLEMRRAFEAQHLEDQIQSVPLAPEVKTDLLARVKELDLAVLRDPGVFTTKLTNLGMLVQEGIRSAATSRPPADAATFLNSKEVLVLTESARTYTEIGTQIRAENELQMYQQSGTRARKVGR